jgi:hypothetical protein
VVVAALVLLCIYILTNRTTHAGISAPAFTEGRS